MCVECKLLEELARGEPESWESSLVEELDGVWSFWLDQLGHRCLISLSPLRMAVSFSDSVLETGTLDYSSFVCTGTGVLRVTVLHKDPQVTGPGSRNGALR